MSQENVERLRAAFEKFLSGSSDFGAELLSPDVEWDATDVGGLPDLQGAYRGPEAVKQYWRDWLAAWKTVQFDYELIDGGDCVVALIDQRMQGRASGIDVPFGKYAHIYTFRDGLIVHWKVYMSQSQALKAVGLEE
jgi:ketosteroid isomerase-like protein